jgi:hypothetical protein
MSAPDSGAPYEMQPITSNSLPPEMDLAVEEVKQEAARQGACTGADWIDGGDAVEAAVEIVGAVVTSDAAAEVASAAIDVGGEVVGGAMEALGSGFEIAGGCAEGCSLMIAVVLLLAAAGSALAFGLF